MGLKNPIGEVIAWNREEGKRETFTILGVVRDVIKGSPYEPVKPSINFLSEAEMECLYIRIKPGVTVHAALSKIADVYNRILPSASFSYRFADEEYNTKFGAEERIGKLASVFATLAIFISCLGLFGLVSFTAEQRTKEIGVRKVLGASVFEVWKLLSKEFVVLVVVACFIAVPLAYYFSNQWLQNYQYRTQPSWWIFGVTSAIALLITLLTVSFEAIKAAIANPVKSLRTE
jgi:ABC-type antimicrobial peptide transport system permease subunit